jgi:uncharacterized repeat protein (TIGR03843 family)
MLQALLASGAVVAHQLHPRASNYTFVVRLRGADGQECLAVYKPQQGEAPLWDFPEGALYKREYATYVMAQALGWDFVPPTVIRDGPYGLGSVQWYVEHNPEEHYLTLRDRYTADFHRICLFDWLSNNADRKAGHCLLGADGRIWGVDHGLTFHAEPKLRTVIWDFAGQPIPAPLVRDMGTLLERLESRHASAGELEELLLPQEMAALRRRLGFALQHPRFPDPPAGRRAFPWPWL